MKKIIFYLTLFIMSLSSCHTHKASFVGTPIEKDLNNNLDAFDKVQLNDLTKFLKDTTETTGMLVLIDGKIVYEYGDNQQISYIASCRKSVLSMLYGRYVMDGSMDLNQDIGSLGIDEKEGLLESEKEATIKDIISSRSGVFYTPANGGYDKNNILERGSVKHGEYFVYNNWDFNVAGHILEQHTGRTVYEELELQLAKPLGFQDWNIKNQKKYYKKKKSQYPAYHIYVSTRDMAKIGQLMLNNGRWNGQQLISEEWIRKSTSVITPVETLIERNGKPRPGGMQMAYGYMWWLVNSFKNNEIYEGAYSASGFGGQYITVIPKANMVIAHKAKLKKLALWGFRPGGVPDWQYWEIMNKVIMALK